MILLIDLAAVLLLVLFRLLVGFPVRVKGSSMIPTLRERQLLWVERTRRFHRGDIVICHFPNRYRGKHKLIPQLFVKRLIGLPGETLTLRDGHLFIDGVCLEETYLPSRRSVYSALSRSWTLGEGQFFVMGDNRPFSHDCRRIGPLDRSLIVGRVSAVLLPTAAFHHFTPPEYPVMQAEDVPENMTKQAEIVS